jgi:hypothetical protein
MGKAQLWRAVNVWFVMFAAFMSWWHIAVAVDPRPPGYYANSVLPCAFLACVGFLPAWGIVCLYRRVVEGKANG